MKRRNNLIKLFIFVAIVGLLNLILFIFGSDSIIDFIGIENVYVVTFLITTFGGLSIVTSVASFVSMIFFASQGANLPILALSGAAGIFISDTFFYFLALWGKKSVPKKWEFKLKKVEVYMKKYPNSLIYFATYLYIGFTPLPNDFLMIALVLGGYSYKQIFWPLIAGNITVAFIVTYFGFLFI